MRVYWLAQDKSTFIWTAGTRDDAELTLYSTKKKKIVLRNKTQTESGYSTKYPPTPHPVHYRFPLATTCTPCS